ncbi:hypothetical protein BZA77DRAFT_289902 [Pyronema omphalodes]|nr:hypothetical protein BZA77DRAFT_289902 [Pyronema omphalodes]
MQYGSKTLSKNKVPLIQDLILQQTVSCYSRIMQHLQPLALLMCICRSSLFNLSLPGGLSTLAVDGTYSILSLTFNHRPIQQRLKHILSLELYSHNDEIEQFIKMHTKSNKKISKSETAEQENVRPSQSAEFVVPPTGDSTPGTHVTTSSFPEAHRSEPATVRRPLSEMSAFEKETEIINAHFFRCLAEAQKELDERDKQIEEIDIGRFANSLAMGRRAKRDTSRRQNCERKRAAKDKPTPKASEARVEDAVETSVQDPVSTSAESPRSRTGKDTFHL